MKSILRWVRSAAENLQIHYGKAALAFLAAGGAAAAWLCLMPAGGGAGPWQGVALALLLPAVWEIVLRLLLLTAYGVSYRYSVFTYFLVDDPEYGFAFRKACRAKDVGFLVFDRFVFKAGTPRLLDLKENIAARCDRSVNSLGFRGPEFDPGKKTARLRIFCSGGSSTAGDRCDDRDTWPAALERGLKDRGFDVEVVNAGVEAWYSYQELLRFKLEIRGYQPDVFLVHEGWNEEFQYSSLQLGENWRPRTVRNARETRSLYCPRNRFLSGTASLAFYLAVQSWRKNLVFVPSMRFTNPRRWETLQRGAYLQAWFDNLAEMARLAHERGILFYTVDYPGLVDMSDTPGDREACTRHSRLNRWYADYQAASKRRISMTLSALAPAVPCLKADEAFASTRGAARARLFYDEVHLNAEGNDLLGTAAAERLAADEAFRRRHEEGGSPRPAGGNVRLDETVLARARESLERNPPYLERFIESKRVELLREAGRGRVDATDIPTSQYTTF